MRRVGIYYAYWTQDWIVDQLPYISRAKRLGFDQLELHGGAVNGMPPAQRERIVEEARSENIRLSYGIGLTQEYDLSSLDESVRMNGVAYMRRMIEAVGSMGGGMIGGTVHSYWPGTLPPGYETKEPFIEQSLKSMRELVKYAEDHQVILNVEVINRFEQFLLNTSAEAVSYVKEIDSPNCRILLDTFHMNIEEDSFYDAIVGAGRYLSALHIGETNRKLPGMGRMPWTEIKTALDDISFDGPIVMEPFIQQGGQIGRDIGIWRELIKDPDLDTLAAQSAVFVRQNLC